jgi:hypothetical protein
MKWVLDQGHVDWEELSDLYRMALLGDERPDALRVVFSRRLLVSLRRGSLSSLSGHRPR